MKFNAKAVPRAAAILVSLSTLFLTGCQKQNNSQAAHQPQATQEKFTGNGRPRLRIVCADDIQKYCAEADRKRRCLRENMDKLSDACKAAVSQRAGRRAHDNGGSDEQ